MITLKYIELYRKYGGDGFLHCATSEERSLVNYYYWLLLDEFVPDLMIVKNGLAFASFIKLLKKRLHENCDNDEIIQALVNIMVGLKRF